MEHILPAYNDPLFSILLVITIGLIIAISTHAWGEYKGQKEAGHLLQFLDKFDSSECTLDTQEMPYEEHMLKPLSLLAKAFETTGEYPKAISIYLYLIKNIPQKMAKIELMEHLGNTYLHAGFLERACSIYTDILRQTPRNTKVLYELGVVYEMMNQYDKAKEVIEPLSLLKEDTSSLKNFLTFSEIINNKHISIEEKVESLKTLLDEAPKLYRQIASALLPLNTYEAWKIIDPNRIKEILDVLWFLPNSQLDLDIIIANHKLSTLYYAKGYLPKLHSKTPDSGIFTVDMVATARQQGFKEAELQFSYLCKKCKQTFPVSFKRCPNCMAIHSMKVEENIEKSSPQTDYSLL